MILERPWGPDGGEAARRVAQAGRATKARLAFLAVTHRYSRTHCLWLEQFQIEYLLSTAALADCVSGVHIFRFCT
jgi:hypothetical protein